MQLSETVPAELFQSIHNLLVGQGFEKSASSLLKEANVDKKKASTSQDLVEIFNKFQSSKKVVKAEVSSSSDSSSSSEDEAPKKTPVASKPVVTKKAASTSSDSSSDSSSEDEAPKKVVAIKTAVKKAASSSSSSESSSSEDEKPKKVVPSVSAKTTPAKKAPASSSSSSSESSSESEDEAPPKKVAKKAEVSAVSASKPPSTPSAETADGKEHKIYVKGLPWLASEAEVKDFFKSCGTIVSTECPMGEDGRSSGTAYVKFSKRSELDAALAMDGQTWPGTERWLKIQEGFDKPDRRSMGGESGPKPEGCDTVFVGNLPWDVEEENMREIFAAAGEISSVRFAMGEDGAFRGFGHVSFFDGNCVDEAIKLAGTQLNGRAIRVDYAPPRNREAGGGRGGGRGDGGRGGRGGGRGDGGRGGRGGGRGTPTAGPVSKAKGSIAVSAGKKMTFDE